MGLMDGLDILDDAQGASGRNASADAPASTSVPDAAGRASAPTAGAVPASAPAPKTRMVPAGSHFAGARAPQSASESAARPAGSRFAGSAPAATPAPAAAPAAPATGRPAGSRFAAADTARATSTPAAPAVPAAFQEPARPAGRRFASAPAAGQSAAGAAAAGRPAGSRFASTGAAAPARRVAASPMTTEQWVAIASSSKRNAGSAATSGPRPSAVAARTPASAPAASAGAMPAYRTAAPQAAPAAAQATQATPAPQAPQAASRTFSRRIPALDGQPAEPENDTSVTASIPVSAQAARTARAARTDRSAAASDPARSHAVQSPVAVGGEPPRGPRGKRRSRDDGGSRRGGSKLSIVLIVLGIILLIVAAGIFVSAQIGYRQAQETYSEIQQYAVSSDEGDGVPDVDFDALAEINPDVVGWLYIPGTVVNYPVVQTDDNTTYLTTLFDLSGNGSGTIFMDMDDTAPGMVDQQTTLYGHHMYDGSMLKVIDNTTNQADFDKIGKVYYITRDATYTMTPLFTAQVEDTYLDARTPNFTGEGESLQAYLEDIYTYAKAQAPDAQERIGSTDKIMSLITCAGEIIPRTTRAVMVLSVDAETARQ